MNNFDKLETSYLLPTKEEDRAAIFENRFTFAVDTPYDEVIAVVRSQVPRWVQSHWIKAANGSLGDFFYVYSYFTAMRTIRGREFGQSNRRTKFGRSK